LQRRASGGRIIQTKQRDRDAWKRLTGAAVRILRPRGKNSGPGASGKNP
jgi:hypothetical protein